MICRTNRPVLWNSLIHLQKNKISFYKTLGDRNQEPVPVENRFQVVHWNHTPPSLSVQCRHVFCFIFQNNDVCQHLICTACLILSCTCTEVVLSVKYGYHKCACSKLLMMWMFDHKTILRKLDLSNQDYKVCFNYWKLLWKANILIFKHQKQTCSETQQNKMCPQPR